MVLGYNYSKQKRQWRRTNAPHSPAVLMATAVCRSNTDGISWCGISRATPEATGCRHQATTCYVLPQRPPGQQAYKQQSTNTPAKMAILMAMAMRRYITARIAQWRRSRASLEATGHCHRASIVADSCNRSSLPWFFEFFHRQLAQKGQRLMLRPLFIIGVLHIKQKRRA